MGNYKRRKGNFSCRPFILFPAGAESSGIAPFIYGERSGWTGCVGANTGKCGFKGCHMGRVALFNSSDFEERSLPEYDSGSE